MILPLTRSQTSQVSMSNPLCPERLAAPGSLLPREMPDLPRACNVPAQTSVRGRLSPASDISNSAMNQPRCPCTRRAVSSALAHVSKAEMPSAICRPRGLIGCLSGHLGGLASCLPRWAGRSARFDKTSAPCMLSAARAASTDAGLPPRRSIRLGCFAINLSIHPDTHRP